MVFLSWGFRLWVFQRALSGGVFCWYLCRSDDLHQILTVIAGLEAEVSSEAYKVVGGGAAFGDFSDFGDFVDGAVGAELLPDVLGKHAVSAAVVVCGGGRGDSSDTVGNHLCERSVASVDVCRGSRDSDGDFREVFAERELRAQESGSCFSVDSFRCFGVYDRGEKSCG